MLLLPENTFTTVNTFNPSTRLKGAVGAVTTGAVTSPRTEAAWGVAARRDQEANGGRDESGAAKPAARTRNSEALIE